MANNQTNRAKKFQEPGHYTDKDRDKIPAEDFAGPDQSFPILTQQDVHDAARLIGHAADPEAVKRRVIAIAKRKGFSLPDAWKDEDDKRATAKAEETRVTGAIEVEQVFTAPITRVDPDKRLVTVTATSEAVDSFNTVFDYEASKKAFQQWVGNIREMHQPKAVGSRVAVHCDDEARKIDVTLRISKGAQDTWEKVLDGTLKGASIGASNVTWVKPTQRDASKPAVPRAVNYNLVELSLVDNPSNPDAYGIAIMRNAEPDASILDVVADDATEETRGNAYTAPANTNEAPTQHDPFRGGDVDAAADPTEALLEAEPEGGAAELHTALRPTKLDGAGSVSAGSEYDEQMTAHGGPPPDPNDSTFAASRPEGVVGSQVRASSGTGGRNLAASVAGLAAASGATAPVVDGDTAPAGAAAGPNPLAPFGMGATLPVNRGKLPSKRERQQAERSAKSALEAEVRRAGDQAAAEAEARYGPWTPASGLEYAAWRRRIEQARGAAEKLVIERQQARAIAEELAAGGNPNAVVRDARGLPHHVGSVATAEAVRAQVAEVTQQQQPATERAAEDVTRAAAAAADVPASLRERIVREYLASQGQAALAPATRAQKAVEAPTAGASTEDESRAMTMDNAAIVQTAPTASAAASEKALLGSGRQAHSHNHAHNGALAHGADGGHAHEHTHLDGTTHSHPHLHRHDHHDHHGEMRAMSDGGHAHEHTHMHDHMHTYRAGQPTDTALVQTEATRAAETRARNTMDLEHVSAPTPVGSLHPVSGSAQSAYTEQPQSPQMSVQNQNVGHMDLLNTEDANAVGFGVPAEVRPVPTPADAEITPPAGLHEGGHQGDLAPAPLTPANNAFVQAAANMQTDEIPHGAPAGQGPMDDDLDHDADEDAREREAAGAANNPTLPPMPRAAGAAEETRESASTAAAALTQAAETAADDTRVGARVSAESRAALHAARDQMERSYQSLCEHCGCAECQAKLDAMAAAAEAYANPERVAALGDVDATTLFGQQRLLQAVVQRGLASFETTLQQTLSSAISPLLATLTATWEQRLADLELTLADGERSTRAEVAQRVQADMTEWTQRVSEPLTQLAQFGQQLSSVVEAASGLTATVARIGEQVEQIAAQPAAVPAPTQYAAAKRFAAPSLDPATTPVGQWSEEQRQLMAQALQAQARATTSPDEQVRLASLAFQLSAQPKPIFGGGSR